MRFFHRLMLRGVLAIVTHPRWTLVVSAVMLVVCSGAAWQWLPISSEQNKLFSSNVQFFHDYLEFNQKFPENEALYVIVESRDPAHPPATPRWTAAAEAITARLRRLTEHVRSVDSRVPTDQLGRQALLFEDAAELPAQHARIRQFGPDVKLWAEQDQSSVVPPLQRFITGRLARLTFLRSITAARPTAEEAAYIGVLAGSWVDALDQPDAPLKPGQGLPDLDSLGAETPRTLGYYYVPDESDPERRRHVLLVRIYPKKNFTALTAVTATVDSIRAAVAEAAQPFSEFSIGLTGRPALDGDEMRTTDQDSHHAEIVALIAVFIGLVVMFRSVWLAVAAELCLGVGIGWTFGWATISVGELNLLSIVFLIALIGIGMDYLVQVLMRYRQESARRSDPARIWLNVFHHIGPPINTACLGAAGAFLVAIFTHFKGAADLGIIAGGGLLLCLVAGYTVLPALLVIWPAKPLKARVLVPARSLSPAAEVRRRRWLVLPALWIVALFALIPLMRRAEFDPGLLNLQAPNLESVQLIRKLQTWSAVDLSKDLDVLRRVRDAVKGAPTLGWTESILNAHDNTEWLRHHAGELPQIKWSDPAPVRAESLSSLATTAKSLADRLPAAIPATQPSDQAYVTSAVTTLRAFSERLEKVATDDAAKQRVADRLSAWQVAFSAQLRGVLEQFNPGDVNIAELPPTLRSHLVSEDGTFALYIYPKEDLWQRGNLSRFVHEIEQRVASVPGAPAPTGIAINIRHSTESIERSFYRTTGYALGLIFLLVLFDLRKLFQTFLAISVLALGLPMLVALMGWLGVSWNFANFFGLPILIGAGHEYGVFMVHRYREALNDPRRGWGRWDTSDRALLLCAFVTSSSFGFFWAIGHHEGLRSLGLVMALGTACIYAATVAVLRPMLRWHLAKKLGGNDANSSLAKT